MLIVVEIPAGQALDAVTDEGLTEIGLPNTYPLDDSGEIIAHGICQPIGTAAHAAGLDGVASRSAAVGGGRELAWSPRSEPAIATERLSFDAWW